MYWISFFLTVTHFRRACYIPIAIKRLCLLLLFRIFVPNFETRFHGRLNSTIHSVLCDQITLTNIEKKSEFLFWVHAQVVQVFRQTLSFMLDLEYPSHGINLLCDFSSVKGNLSKSVMSSVASIRDLKLGSCNAYFSISASLRVAQSSAACD